MMGRGFGMMGTFDSGGMFLWLLFIVIIIVIVVYFALRFGAGGFRRPLSDDPLDILKRRYAKGEITKEDFERMRKELQI